VNDLFSYLVAAVSAGLGGFLLACGLDVGAGMLLAWRQGKFDPKKLPTFLESQFATRQFLGVLGLGVAAAVPAILSTVVHGGLTQDALLGVAQIALAAMTVGAAAMLASVLSDFRDKISQLFGGPAPLPGPQPDPIPVVVVDPLPPGDPPLAP
jgi:hypothetical protein